MIKKIHILWFGGKKMPSHAIKNINNIKKVLPDWEVLIWSEKNYEIKPNTYAQYAYNNGQFAHLSDYARLEILYKHGGVYIDIDQTITDNISELIGRYDSDCIIPRSNFKLLSFGFIYSRKQSEFIKELKGLVEKNKSFKSINEVALNIKYKKSWKTSYSRKLTLLDPHILTFKINKKENFGEQLFASSWNGVSEIPGSYYFIGKKVYKHKILYRLFSILRGNKKEFRTSDILMMNTYDHTKIGGTETFDNILTKQLQGLGYVVTSLNEREVIKEDIVRAPIFNDQLILKGNILFSKIKHWYRFRKVKNMKIIMNTFRGLVLMPKKFLKNNKVIIQQHFTADHILGKVESGIIKVIFNRRVKYIDKFVVFSESDKNKFKHIIKQDKIIVSPLCTEEYNSQSKSKKSGFVYIGRIEKDQKNIIDLCKMFDSNKVRLDVYGSGTEVDNVIKLSETSKYIKYNGIAKADEVKKIFSKYKANILYSDFEGMPFSILEAASAGTPTITTDSFIAAKGMFKNKKLGILSNKVDFIKNVINFNEDKHQSITEYNEKYSTAAFSKKWKGIVED